MKKNLYRPLDLRHKAFVIISKNPLSIKSYLEYCFTFFKSHRSLRYFPENFAIVKKKSPYVKLKRDSI